MYPLGHIGIAFFLGTLFLLPALFAALGAILPDVVDKMFFWANLLPCGRSIGHNVFFAPAAAAITFAFTRKKSYALAILFGGYLHLLQDSMNFIPWFYPLIQYDFKCPPPFTFHVGIFEYVTEIIGAVLIIIAIVFKKKITSIGQKLSHTIKKVK